MNLLSALPSLVAKIADLIERNVTSTLTVEQACPFPLMAIPFADRDLTDLTGTQIISDSFTFLLNQTMTNSPTALNSQLGFLSRGVWDLTATTHYTSNYVQNGVIGLQIGLITAVVLAPKPLIALSPAGLAGSNIFQTVTRRMTVDSQRYLLAITLTNNGVGQTHSHVTVLSGNRLL